MIGQESYCMSNDYFYQNEGKPIGYIDALAEYNLHWLADSSCLVGCAVHGFVPVLKEYSFKHEHECIYCIVDRINNRGEALLKANQSSNINSVEPVANSNKPSKLPFKSGKQFVKYDKPCNECGSKDGVGVNANGDGLCFACQPNRYIKNYDPVISGEEPWETIKFREHGLNPDDYDDYGNLIG